MMLGAGTVLDPETARACMLAGAEFFVTPALRVSTIEMAKRYSKVIFPGALTPTEVLTAWEAGADAVKIFPCGNVGGPKYIKALKGPFPQIEMIPTGGVNLETAGDFLKAGACAIAVGSEMVDAKTIKEGRFDVIEERARQYLACVAKARAENEGGVTIVLQAETQRKPKRSRKDTSHDFLCASLCVLCVSALNRISPLKRIPC